MQVKWLLFVRSLQSEKEMHVPRTGSPDSVAEASRFMPAKGGSIRDESQHKLLFMSNQSSMNPPCVCDGKQCPLVFPNECSHHTTNSSQTKENAPLAISYGTQMHAMSTLQRPEGLPNLKSQPEGKTKHPQLQLTYYDYIDAKSSLTDVPCETLPNAKMPGLRGPCNKQLTSQGLGNLSIGGCMDRSMLREFDRPSSICFSNHEMWENDLFGNIVCTHFSTNAVDCSMSMKTGNSLLTLSVSSDAIRSSTSGTGQLEMLVVSPDHSTPNHSAQLSMFRMGDELSAALASGFRKSPRRTDLAQTQKEGKQSCSFNYVEVVTSHTCSESVEGFNSSANFNELIDISSGFSFFLESKEDHLLEAVVAHASSSEKPTSFSCTIGEISSHCDPLKKTNGRQTSIQSCSEISETGGASYGKNDCPIEDATQFSSTVELLRPTNTSSEKESASVLRNLPKDACGGQSEVKYLEDEKEEVTTKASHKRSKTGGAARPRPKDRQQIQDRVRELRDIVPNANKCSIDALLDRTVKYIKFLHSVTSHVGNWSHKGVPKIDGNEAIEISSEESKSGASWAVDIGADGELKGRHCPIVVENLSLPGQMLVEILCEDKGIFLEIADNIRCLGLTILKGLMEVRNENIWARFVVQGSEHVHRVEILWSLAQIIEFASSRRPNTEIPNQR